LIDRRHIHADGALEARGYAPTQHLGKRGVRIGPPV
jgi:hypothetical protein